MFFETQEEYDVWKWLNKEWGLLAFLPYTALFIVTYLVWCATLYYLGMIPAELYEGTEDIVFQSDPLFWVMLFEAAMIEELLFRTPLTFIVRILKHPLLVMLAVFGLSGVFGYIHQMSWWSVPIQGFFGVMISVMYLKFGGARGKFIKPLLCTSMAHFSANALLFLVQYHAANL